jgi:hypothetical protein
MPKATDMFSGESRIATMSATGMVAALAVLVVFGGAFGGSNDKTTAPAGNDHPPAESFVAGMVIDGDGGSDLWAALVAGGESLAPLLGPSATAQMDGAWGSRSFQVSGYTSTWATRFRSLFSMGAFYEMLYTQSFERSHPGRDGFKDDQFRADAKNLAAYKQGFGIHNMEGNRNNNFVAYLRGNTLVENHAEAHSPTLRRLNCW